MTRREQRNLALSLGVATLVAVVLTFALWNQSFPTLQAAANDIFFQTWSKRGVRDVAANVVIVAIDDAAIQQLGRHGDWPRRYYAEVVRRLKEGYARGLVFDIGFTEPHADDPAVAAAFRSFLDVSPEELQAAGVPVNRRTIVSPVVGVPNTARVTRAGSPFEFPGLLEPQADYLDASTALGHANVIPDKDGTVRRSALLIRARDRTYPSLSLAAAMAYTNTLGRGFSADPDGRGVIGANRLIPTDPFFNMIISFGGPPSHVGSTDPQTFHVISFADVLMDRVDPSIFRDKMVFLGLLDATGFADDYQVPTSSGLGKMHGVEIHANAFSTMVSARFFTEPPLALSIGSIWLACLATGLLAARFSVILVAVGAVIVGAGYFFGSLIFADYAFDPMGVTIPNLVYPPASLLLSFLSVATYRVVFEQAEARATRAAMGKYLSPAVLAEVMKEPDKLRLGGEKRVMTVLFTDIRGFTSFSERLDPEVLVPLLNEYLTVMSDVVYRWEGVLDKYMGDAIMAWWGAPTDQPDHPYRACMAGLEMRAELAKLHVGWRERGLPALEMGVGVNTGPMIYGNTGSTERFDFTVLGDAVNLAARLEGANKEYGSNVIISDTTYEQVKDRDFVVRFLDVIEVKGKSEPGGIYELLGMRDQVNSDNQEMLEAWETAMNLYQARDFALAQAAFERVTAIRPNDGPAQVYVERCADLRENPPAADWDGVFVLTHK